jgi:hypothetical protein
MNKNYFAFLSPGVHQRTQWTTLAGVRNGINVLWVSLKMWQKVVTFAYIRATVPSLAYLTSWSQGYQSIVGRSHDHR